MRKEVVVMEWGMVEEGSRVLVRNNLLFASSFSTLYLAFVTLLLSLPLTDQAWVFAGREILL